MRRAVGIALQVLGVVVFLGGAVLNGAFQEGLTDRFFSSPSLSWPLIVIASVLLLAVGERLRTGSWPSTRF